MDDIFDPGLLRENPRQMSAATLAFLGDAVYELLARQKLAVTTIPAGKLHRMAIGMVCAGAQSQACLLYTSDPTDEIELTQAVTAEEVRDYMRAAKLSVVYLLAGRKKGE